MLSTYSLKDYAPFTLKKGVFDINPFSMDSNFFAMNGKCFPATDPLIINKGDRVRIRFGNIGINNHPIHLHGHQFSISASDGNTIDITNRLIKNTILISSGSTWDIIFEGKRVDVPPTKAKGFRLIHYLISYKDKDPIWSTELEVAVGLMPPGDTDVTPTEFYNDYSKGSGSRAMPEEDREIADFKTKMLELNGDIESAERDGDNSMAQEARQELEEIEDYHNQFAERIYLRETFSDSGVGEDLPLGFQLEQAHFQ